MPDLSLPLVALNTSLRDAFRTLQDEKLSALAVHTGLKVGVVTARQIIQAANAGEETLAAIEPLNVTVASRKRSIEFGSAKQGRVQVRVGGVTRALWMRGPARCQCGNPEDPHGPYLPSDDGRKCDECEFHVHCAPWGD